MRGKCTMTHVAIQYKQRKCHEIYHLHAIRKYAETWG